ncbi:MAG: hypothetical protein WBD40_09300 [Tepidisphaeraceae bacterium]
MASTGQLKGMAGLYLVAAELSRRGFIASPTSRSAQGADLLVTDRDCNHARAVQVKTNASTFGFWLMGEKNLHMKSRSLVYAFVNLRKGRTEFFVVPSDVVAAGIKVSHRKQPKSEPMDTVPYRDNWPLFDQDPDAHS